MPQKSLNKIIFLVSNDLIYDQRVHRHAKLMMDNNFEVLLLGRIKKTTDLKICNEIPMKRFKLPFERSWLFYAALNIRFFIYLLFAKFDVIWSNDLDTLPVAFFISKIRRKKIFYDSHEFFTGVPELKERHRIRKIWGQLERFLLKRIEFKITVSNGIKDLYKDIYKTKFEVIMNISNSDEIDNTVSLPKISNFSFNQPFLIYQGALNKDRGLETLILSMKDVSSLKLLIAGAGDLDSFLKNMVKENDLQDQVYFTGMLEPKQLKIITPKAVAGLSIEIPSNENYSNCLPNKFFDYVHAGIPIIAYPNKEIKLIIEKYNLGYFIENHEPHVIAKVLNSINKDLKNQSDFKKNIEDARNELNWEKESNKLLNYFLYFFNK